MEDIEKMPTSELMTELSKLEKKIELEIIKYNLMSRELCNRFPILKDNDDFKPKILTKGEYKI